MCLMSIETLGATEGRVYERVVVRPKPLSSLRRHDGHAERRVGTKGDVIFGRVS